MKILHIFDHSIPIQDGYATRSRCIINQQRKNGWQTSHLTGPKQGSQENVKEEISELSFYRTKSESSFFHNLPIIKQFATIYDIYKRLLEVAKTEKPNILHAHSPSLNGVATALVSKKLGIPFVYEIRAFWEDAAVDQGTNKEGDIRYQLTRAMENWVVKRAKSVFTICEGLKQDLESRGVCKSPIVVIPNAVDLNQLEEPLDYQFDIAKKFELTKGKTLGFIGSFYDYEGLNLLIDSIPDLLEWDNDIRVLLIGGGNEYNNLKGQVSELGLDNKVYFTGKIPYEDVSKYYSVIDVLVYPRKSMRLTELVTPLKPLEAMAQNKLFIASDVGGHKELVISEETGILFQNCSKDDLINNIKRITEDKTLQKKLLKNSKKHILEERNWKLSVSKYQPIYLSITREQV